MTIHQRSGVAVDRVSKSSAEYEVLIPRNKTFRVTGYKFENGTHRFDLTEK